MVEREEEMKTRVAKWRIEFRVCGCYCLSTSKWEILAIYRCKKHKDDPVEVEFLAE
jgi:hypothetical protein